MVYRRVQSERDLTSSRDTDSRRASTAPTTDIAPQIVGCQVCDWGVVVGVLANVLEDAILGRANRQLLENVMSRHVADGQRQGCQAESGLHRDGMRPEALDSVSWRWCRRWCRRLGISKRVGL